MKLELVNGFEDANSLATRVASDLKTQVLELLKHKETVNLVVTGGTVGTNVLEHLGKLLSDADLSNLHIWWTDERFVGQESEDRNYLQAERAFISQVSIPQENIHEMPSLEDGELRSAAESFASEIESLNPHFDIVILGMGPDGHVASLFPGSPGITFGSWVVAEENSPKPPKERISLSYSALSSSEEVWFIVAGSEKSDAVAAVFDKIDLPATKVNGKSCTRWYLDKAAGSKITS